MEGMCACVAILLCDCQHRKQAGKSIHAGRQRLRLTAPPSPSSPLLLQKQAGSSPHAPAALPATGTLRPPQPPSHPSLDNSCPHRASAGVNSSVALAGSCSSVWPLATHTRISPVRC